jgi:hypothetical protein
MTYTPYNYIENSCLVPVGQLPEPLKKGHKLALKAFDHHASAYKANDIVRTSMDHYLTTLNEFVAKEQFLQPLSNDSNTAVISNQTTASADPNLKKQKPTESKARAAKQNAAVKRAPSPVAKPVERIPEEIRFLRRYVAMHGKVKTRMAVVRLLSSLQKAMLEKRIRKTSPYAKEIMQMQDQLIKASDRMREAAEMNITKANLEHYREITSSHRIRDSIALLKRFVAIQGREGVQDKAERLIAAMERMVKNGKVSKDDPYSARLNDAYKSLKLYIREKKKTPEIQSGELNGIYGLLGMAPTYASYTSPRKSKGLGSVMSSADLVNMDFDTIGLKGKFRELMGDPSVGFTAMVFGQPKSGKSTLMLEFAHHLAVHHGEVLYVAFEEGYGYTLKEKITRIGAIHPRLNFSESMPKDVASYDFVFIDSVSRAGMELDDLVKLKNRYPHTSFVFIFHATKDGKFRGGNELAHEVDVIIEVENKMATASGRFNAGGQLKF